MKTATMARDAKAKNVINVLNPYRTSYGTWVYDDPDIGVHAEAFVCGSSEVIDHLVGKDTNKFTALISKDPIPGYQARLVRLKEKEKEDKIQGWYQLEGTNMEHWLCGCVLDYFEGYPDNIYVQLSNFQQ